jgi:mono/diheme cytochrome c family protein
MSFAVSRSRAVARRLAAPAALALVALLPGAAAALTPAGARGEALFQQRCVACHTVGEGDRVGPDLSGVTGRRDAAWLARWIGAPDRVLAAGDPIARGLLEKYRNVPMPNQGLTADEVGAVVAYLAEARGAAPAAGAPPAAAAPAGDAAAGKDLFTGTRPLANGGPACMACHSIAGLGALGGGALGPDLTTAAAKYGEGGLASVLASVPFPTMSPIFARRPLAPEEQADLRAFIQQAAVTGRPPQAMGRLAGFAVGGAAVLLLVAQFTWRRRLRGVRRRMLAQGASRRRA